MAAERHTMGMERDRLLNDQAGMELAQRRRLTGLNSELGDYVTGTNRQATNANLDADFAQAEQATMQGLQPPSMVGGSNAANEAALTVQAPVNTSSSDYRLGLNKLSQRVAAAKGDIDTMGRLADQGQKLVTDESRKSEYKRIKSLSDDELASAVGSWFSKDGSGVPAMLAFDPKAKQFLFTSQVPGLPTGTLSRAELENYALGAWEAGEGDMEKGMRMQLATVASKRDLDAKNEGRASTLANANYKLWDSDRNFGLKEQELADARSYRQGMLGVSRQNSNRPDLMQMYDAKGNVVLVDKRTMQPVTMPEGLRMPKLPQELTERQKMQLTAYNKALEGLPSDLPRAQLDALAARYGVSDILGGAGGLSWGESPAAKPATTPQQPPVQGLRQPQITTLSAPRSGAEARGIMQPQLSDEELFIRSMGVR